MTKTGQDHLDSLRDGRNVYLDGRERGAAPVLYRALCLAKALWESGTRDAEGVRQRMLALIAEEPLACADYVSIARADTLEELEEIAGAALVSLAVRIGQTRLIDNLTL